MCLSNKIKRLLEIENSLLDKTECSTHKEVAEQVRVQEEIRKELKEIRAELESHCTKG